ncbi:hypothetical protein SDC9_109155 [bioreactor metagenome]|uniref:Uncharacterized protein n=1 Tax=bioreactor metagenome TaxID=1076179 RepID=A0A645B9Z1_9ZZZZ
MSSGKDYDRTAGFLFNFHNENFDMIADTETVGGHLLRFHQGGLVLSKFEYHVSCDRLYYLDDAGYDIFLFAFIFFYHHSAFCLSYGLNDDHFCSLSGNTAEIFGLYFKFNYIAQLRFLICLMSFIKRYFIFVIRYFFDNGALAIHFNCFFLHIKRNSHITVSICIFFICGQERRLDFFEHIALRYALFLFQRLECVKKFIADHFAYRSFQLFQRSLHFHYIHCEYMRRIFSKFEALFYRIPFRRFYSVLHRW